MQMQCVGYVLLIGYIITYIDVYLAPYKSFVIMIHSLASDGLQGDSTYRTHAQGVKQLSFVCLSSAPKSPVLEI